MSNYQLFKDKVHQGWNKLPTLPNIHEHPRARKAASVITRVGFTAKCALYLSIGALAINSARYNTAGNEAGPSQISENLRSTYVFLIILCIGLFCYATFALLFAIFDFDQVGHHGIFPILSRFGRLFSAGFYAYIGVNGVAILINVHNANGGTSNSLIAAFFKTNSGKGAIVFLGVVFCVVALVYLIFIIRPTKFRRELASEKMHPTVFTIAVWVARVGALGRVLFFTSFGVVLIVAVRDKNSGKREDTSILGLAAVLNHLADFCMPLMVVTATLLIVYAAWCLILVRYRRLPAHYSERSALAAVGLEYFLKHPRAQANDSILVQKQGEQVVVEDGVALEKLTSGHAIDIVQADEIKPQPSAPAVDIESGGLPVA